MLRSIELFSVPEVGLRISERPVCPRPRRFGNDYVADRDAAEGVFYVDAGDGMGGSCESRALLRARCLERTWGGDHLLSWAAGPAARRLPRRLTAGGGFAPAWGLYLSGRLMDLGYLDREGRLLTMVRRRAAIARALLDLDLHMGLLDGPQARERLAAIPDADDSDLVFVARHPGSAVASVLGWQAMNRARAAAMGLSGEVFSEDGFNDRLLARGPIPLSLVLPVVEPDAVPYQRHSGT